MKRPDATLQVAFLHDGNAVGLVKFAGHLGQQLVGRHANRAGEAGLFKNRPLDQPRQRPPAVPLATGHVGEVDVHLVNAPVFYLRRDLGNLAFEQARKAPDFVKIDRQHDGLRAQLGRLHQAHGRTDAKLPRRIGRGGDHAPANVIFEQRKFVHRNETQRPFAMLGQQRRINRAPPAANHHRQALELWITQQLDRCKECIHVEMGDAPGQGRCLGGGCCRLWSHDWNCAALSALPCMAQSPCDRGRPWPTKNTAFTGPTCQLDQPLEGKISAAA